jgi:hypothetical protein
LCPIAIAPPPQIETPPKSKRKKSKTKKITHGDVKPKFPHLASHHSNKKQTKKWNCLFPLLLHHNNKKTKNISTPSHTQNKQHHYDNKSKLIVTRTKEKMKLA